MSSIFQYIEPLNINNDRLDPHYYEIKEKIYNHIGSVNSVQLSDLCEGISDGTRNAKDFSNEGIPYIKISNINNKEIQLTNVSYLTNYLGVESKAIIKKGDILISKVAAIPKVAIVGEEVEGAIISPDLLRLRPKNLKAKDIIFNFLNTELGQLSLKLAVTPSVIPKISIKEIGKMLIPLDEQFTNTSKTLDSEQVNYKKQLESFYNVDKSRYLEVFQPNPIWVSEDLSPDRLDFLYYQQRKTRLHKDFIERLKIEEWVQLNEVVEIVDRTISPSEYKDQTISYIGIKNLNREKWIIRTTDKVPYKTVRSRARYELKAGDILLGVIGTKIGEKEQPLAIVPNYFANSIASNVFVVLRTYYLPKRYILWCLTHPFVRLQLRIKSRGGIQPFLSIHDLKQILVPRLPNKKVIEIDSILDRYQGGDHLDIS
ncbi:restriction endonuclease subunit S [Rossellomorea sp. DA94]|uniref:restriction endonuclease subunit S n=1 Tax=Rossellomorea sp. DA94 TaxID=3038653 RepID=UPI00244B27BD|nr:restriction endonuclease subunit S [Rossellomorea sp. DA94]WGG46466.1 restriction endonuclease subunit S [Rossellomorea sp. DA94]